MSVRFRPTLAAAERASRAVGRTGWGARLFNIDVVRANCRRRSGPRLLGLPAALKTKESSIREAEIVASALF